MIITDLKDCFFQYPSSSSGCLTFCFFYSFSTIAFAAFPWDSSSPRDEKFSHSTPDVCSRDSPIHQEHPQAIILHYMDDILISAAAATSLNEIFLLTITADKTAGFVVAEDKIQKFPPWEIFGLQISE